MTAFKITSGFLTGALMLLGACSSHESGVIPDSETLVSVGDSALKMADVLPLIPSGLSSEDSVAMFNRIVDEWIRDMALTEYARKNIPDLDRINRLTDAYRSNLIVNSYLQNMIESGRAEVSESRIRQYFDANRENMVLEEPIIRGAFLKVSESEPVIDKLRAWMAEFTEASIDKVEEAGLRYASNYRYFRDEWQSWSAIAEQIPYRFYDADAFVRSTRDFETSDSGSLYLLHISEYLPSGSEMPYEYARGKIREILINADLGKRRDRLITDIYRKQIKEGILKPGRYDPLTGTIKNDN